MELIYHRLIQQDLYDAIEHYEREGGERLGNRFFYEVEAALGRIVQNPQRHHFSDGGLRRAALKSFPYHFLYEFDGEVVWVAVLRHDRRNPRFGLRRRR